MTLNPHTPHFGWFAAPQAGVALLGAALRGGLEARPWP